MPPVKDKWVRRFVITETDRHKRGFTIYKVTSIMFMKTSPDIISKVSIWKRYSDFRKLHATLNNLYSSLENKEPFPSFPKPRFFGRFETEVIEERKDCALRLLTFIAKHSALYSSDVFVKFFESSHLDRHLNDCSQSISSDTSEDDRGFAENPERFRHSQSLAKGFRKFICTDHKSSVSKDQLKEQPYEKAEIVIAENSKNHNSNNNEEINVNGVVIAQEAIKEEMTVIHDGSDLPKATNLSAQYILIAAAHMSAAFRHEAIAEYEEAFTQYKLGISNLMNGIQNDSDVERKNTIKDKIRKYLQRAEKLYNRHLNCNISMLSKPVLELQNYKVLGLVQSLMLVKDTLRGFTRVIKTIAIPEGNNDDISSYILRGKVPYMIQLHACIQTNSTVFLVLQYIRKGRLWDFIKSCYKLDKKVDLGKRKHTRSFSCDAIIQPNFGKACNDSLIIEEKQNSSPKTTGEELETKINVTCIPSDSELTNKAEFAENSSHGDINTNQLLANAQKLLLSVNATLKKSNSIATRLNESQQLLYSTENAITNLKSASCKLPEEAEQNSCDENVKNKQELESSRCKRPNSDTFKFYLSTMSDNVKSETIAQFCGDICDEVTIGNSDFNAKFEAKFKGKFEDKFKGKFEDKFNEKIEAKFNEKFEDKFNEIVEEEDDILWKISEDVVRLWSAQILVALESLHQQDTIVADLRPKNILINDEGNAVMTYVPPRRNFNLLKFKEPYSSPELCAFAPPIVPTTAVDIWSFGVLLYELFTGLKFQCKHSGEFHSYSTLYIPDVLTDKAKSLLLSILKYEPNERLTIPEIKRHPFFVNVDWLQLLNT